MIKLDKGGRPKKNSYRHTVTGKNRALGTIDGVIIYGKQKKVSKR